MAEKAVPTHVRTNVISKNGVSYFGVKPGKDGNVVTLIYGDTDHGNDKSRIINYILSLFDFF